MTETVGRKSKKHKICTKCLLVTMFSNFGKRSAVPDGMKSQCKKCDREIGIERRRTKEGLIKTIYDNQVNHSRHRNDPSPEYSYKELYLWMMDNDDFHKLYKLWTISRYDQSKTPSCDRLDDYKGYSLSRLQIITWQENRSKGDKDRVSGKNTKQSKKVSQTTSDNVLINTFHSISNAAKETGLHVSAISKCCSGGLTQTGGYKWAFVVNNRDNSSV